MYLDEKDLAYQMVLFINREVTATLYTIRDEDFWNIMASKSVGIQL